MAVPRPIAIALLLLAAGATGLGCLPDLSDYWASLKNRPDAAAADTDVDGDIDGDADGDGDGDTDTEECSEEDGGICGDAGDTDPIEWDGSIGDAGDFCGDPQYEIFVSGLGYPFHNEDAPYRGTPAAAEAVVTGYSYFHCSHCANAALMIEEIYDNPLYSERSVYYFRHYPFGSDSTSAGWKTHRTAHAADLQGLFWPVHDAFYGDFPVVDESEMLAIAADAGCDMDLFATDFDSSDTVDHLAADKAEGVDAGIYGTPSIFVNGIKVSPWSSTQAVLDCLLGYTVYVPPDAGPDGG